MSENYFSDISPLFDAIRSGFDSLSVEDREQFIALSLLALNAFNPKDMAHRSPDRLRVDLARLDQLLDILVRYCFISLSFFLS